MQNFADQTRVDTEHRYRVDMLRLTKCVAALTPAQETSIIYGEWTVRELLQHIAAWDRELVRGFRQLRAGRRPSLADYDEAEFNARAARVRGDVSLPHLLDDAHEAHEELVALMETLSEAEWRRPTAHRWSNGAPMTVGSLFSYQYHGESHYAGHAREIEDWAAGLPPPAA